MSAPCNAPRLPGMSPLRKVIQTLSCDDVVRVELLECGHIKTTLTASARPAKCRRCHKCADAEGADTRYDCGGECTERCEHEACVQRPHS